MSNKAPPKAIFVEVTTTQRYIFDAACVGQFKSPQQLIDEWFWKYPINSYHAAREGSAIGGDKKVVSVRILDPKELEGTRLIVLNNQAERAAIDLHKQAEEKSIKFSSKLIKELGTNCFACSNKLNRKYVIRQKAGTLFGVYCSAGCARSEVWGPALREAKIIRITKKNVVDDKLT